MKTIKEITAVLRKYSCAILLALSLAAGAYASNMAYAYGHATGYADGYEVASLPVNAYEAKEDVRIQRIAITNYLVSSYGVDLNEAFRLADYFLESAGEYNLDPYLLVAQTWAESRFINGALSEEGAIGLMQVMPFWAKGAIPFVRSVADLRNPRINIRAGARIMRHYRDIASRMGMANLTESTLRAYHGGVRAMTKPKASTLKYINFIKIRYKAI